ncbi:MAG TPA: methyl-accepting chemotaxis protein, partial [Clostridia bacterium]|nr:methyl-accepting chemotaxis protein [Clostridia bacterium]
MVKRFINLKVFAKFMVMTLVFFLFLGGTGLFSLWSLQRTEQVYAELLERQLAIKELVSGVKLAVTQSGLSALEHITAIDPTRKSIFENEIREWQGQLEELVAAYKEQPLSAEEQEALARFEGALTQYQSGLNKAVEFNNQGLHEEAQNYYLTTIGRKNLTFLSLDQLEELSNQEVQRLEQKTKRNITRIRNNVVITLIAALVVATGVSAAIARGFSRRLQKLENYVKQGATGDLTMEILVDGTDEIGSLAGSFRRMIENWRQVIEEVKEGAVRSAQVAEDFLTSINETGRAVEQVNHAIQEV